MWTDGNLPSGSNTKGTGQLANSTMETFQQPSHCFKCHSGHMLGTDKGGGMSHIWGTLKSLFP
jgi:hypothetical protein